MSFATYLNRTFPNGAERFFASPPGRRLVARAEQEHAAEVDVQRAALAERVAEKQQKLDAAWPDLEREAATAEQAYARAKAAVDAAAAKLRIARNRKAAALLGTESQITALKGQLRRSAPPAIDAFVDQLRAEWEELRETPYVSDQAPAGYRGRRPIAKHFTNAAAVKRRLNGLLAAMREAEVLKEQAIPAENLPAIFEDIRAALPDASQLEEIVPIEQAIGHAWSAAG